MHHYLINLEIGLNTFRSLLYGLNVGIDVEC